MERNAQKKQLIILVFAIFALIMLSGCNNQQSNRPSQEVLDANIRYAVDKCIEGGGIPNFFSDGTFSGCKRKNFIKIN